MLVYNPAFDLYHGIYRMLLLLQHIKGDSIEIDKLRIWDYYYLFPSEVTKTATFPNEVRELRRVFNFKDNPYENIADSKRTLNRLEGYQLSALKCLARLGISILTNLAIKSSRRRERRFQLIFWKPLII